MSTPKPWPAPIAGPFNSAALSEDHARGAHAGIFYSGCAVCFAAAEALHGVVAASIDNKALASIVNERAAQDTQWGGEDHDDEHEAPDWCAFIAKQLGRAASVSLRTDEASKREQRSRLVKIAALAIAAIESADRWEAAK